ncbi:MAG: hypothetical protein LBD02_01250 [Christensenellaceae bacterium]|jgi:hypothetical protein|nr:hypothetical protein [Christensenellaceae bacterium]
MSEILELKIVDVDYTGKDVASLPDVLTGTPAENKAVFDTLVKELVAPRLNALIDLLNGQAGAAQIGAENPVSVTEQPVTVQEALSLLRNYVDGFIEEYQSPLGASQIGLSPIPDIAASTVQEGLHDSHEW